MKAGNRVFYIRNSYKYDHDRLRLWILWWLSSMPLFRER